MTSPEAEPAPEAEPVPEPARVLAGRYRLESVIGRGGMGAIWRAHDELLDRDVAIKEIIWPPELSQVDRDIGRSRAVREAQLAARLRHPNVVGVYDIVEEDDRPCIVMELVPFRSLRDAVIEDGPMAPPEAARIGLEVLAALQAVHDTGVVHRDVKPGNILLGPEGRVVLTDFGIAKAADSAVLTSSGMLMGSPSFVAPERARGHDAETASDLWALGASLYTAVEGRPPFERETPLASLTAVVADELDQPAGAGPLWPVIEGLLRKDPQERLSAYRAEGMLRRVADGETPAAASDTPTGDDGESWDESRGWEDGGVWEDSTDWAGGDGGESEAEEPSTPGEPAAAGRSRPHLIAGLAVLALAAIAGIVAGLVVIARAPGRDTASPAASTRPAASGQAAPGRAVATPKRSATATSSPAATLPAGYERFTDPTGFSIGAPDGWQVSHEGQDVYLTDPANSSVYLLVDQSDRPKANPLADWEQQAASRQSSYPDYHLIRLQAVPYAQAIKAADWQFTYDHDGTQVEVLNRNVLANSHHAYALYWSTPVSDWAADYHYFDAFAATFLPAS